MNKLLAVVILNFSLVQAEEENPKLREMNNVLGNAPPRIHTILNFSELKKYREFVNSGLSKLKKISHDNGVRVWAIDVSGNANHYLLSLKIDDLEKVVFYCHKTNKIITTKLQNGGNKDLFNRVDTVLSKPLLFPKDSATYAASVQHLFIVEKLLHQKYLWAIREYQGDKADDYFDLIKFFSNVVGAKVSMAWRVDQK